VLWRFSAEHDRIGEPENVPRASKNASKNPSAVSRCARCRECVIREAFSTSPSASCRRLYLYVNQHATRLNPRASNDTVYEGFRKPSHRSCNSVASPARNSSVPDCEARLTAQQPDRGSALDAAVSMVVGSRSVLFSRINVFSVTRGASSAGISSRGPEGVTETASGNESTRIEASVT
jgi:hypothetical protein